MKVTVRYHVATYSGSVTVYASDDTDDETLLSRAKKQLSRRAGGLPFGYQSFKIISKEIDE